MEILHKQVHKMCVSVCVSLCEIVDHITLPGGPQLEKGGKIASKIISDFFWLKGLIRMGYEYFYQNIAEWLLLSMLIFIDSPLQILILDNFF